MKTKPIRFCIFFSIAVFLFWDDWHLGVVFSLVIIDVTECFLYSDESYDSEESQESREYGKILDLRGTLRQQFGLIASLQYPHISSVCSPISALVPLGQMALGAHGSSLNELNKAIGISHDDSVEGYGQDVADSVKRHMAVLIKDLEDLPGVILNVASRLYVSEEKNLYKNYTKAAERIFKTTVEKANFRNPNAAAASINHWVAYQTHGKIKELISPADISSSASLIAVNAIYFCGHWEDPFPKVEPGPFYSPNGVKNIPMMSNTEWFNYGRSKSLSAELVEIPYVGRKSTFLIVLPKKKSGLPKLLNKLKRKPDLLGRAIKKMENVKVILTIPKFKTESQWDLSSLYKDVELSSIFKRRKSGLTSIVQGEEMELSGAVHKAIIEVNELGTKGAAASGTVFVSHTTPIKFTADRPFLFYVLANSQQVFAGVTFGLEIVNLKESRRDTDNEDSQEIEIYENVFDLRGTLRQRFGLISALQYPAISSICSPISALLPLGKMALGAHGSSLRQLNKVIGIKTHGFSHAVSDDGSKSLERHLSRLIKDLEDLPGVTLDVASRLYVSEDKKLYKNYTKLAKSIFKSSIEKTSFENSKEAASMINHWVLHQTHGMIPELISPDAISPTTSLIAVNAIYFAGKWERIFPKAEPGTFYSPNGVKNIPMMTNIDWYNYVKSEALSAQLVEIPYAEKKSSFLIVFPTKEDGLKSLLELLKKKPQLLGKTIRQMKSTNIRLTIPKFKIESEWDLKALYQEMGLSTVFNTDTSGLSAIVENEHLVVSAAIQKAIIDVTEQGTKAAAASATILLTYSLPIEFKAEHPFLFYVMANSQQLFTGTYN